MTTDTIAFQTPADAPRWKRLAVYSPLARIFIFALMAAAALFILSIGARFMGLDVKGADVTMQRISVFVRQLVPFLGAYLVLVYFIEKRRPTELAWSKVLPHGFAGLALGTAFICATIGVMWLTGNYEVTGTDPDVDWIRPLFLMGLGTAIAEEIVFRGVIFRAAEEGLGTWPAVAISAVLFGGVHILNPGATPWSSFAIAVEAGVLLGMAYHLTRSLPLVMGIHMAWNFVQGTVFGVAVSGTAAKGWLVSTRPGNEWLSGGDFGAEASVVAVVLSLVASAAMMIYAQRNGTIFVRRRGGKPIIEDTSQSAPC